MSLVGRNMTGNLLRIQVFRVLLKQDLDSIRLPQTLLNQLVWHAIGT